MSEQFQIIKAYLAGLENGDVLSIIDLFHPSGMVLSPLYGKQPANIFYRDLFSDTNASKITHLESFWAENGKSASVNFIYEWEMADGKLVAFDCVDVFEFDEHNKITLLKIIYDTAATRSAWEALQKI